MKTAAANISSGALPDERLVARDLASFISVTGVPAIGVDISVGGNRLNVAAGTRKIGADYPLTADSRFRISCLVKVFGSLVCLKLAQAGLLDIDAPIGTYLPELGVTGQAKGARIRVRHLLTHTAGYRSPSVLDVHTWVQWTWEECILFLHGTPQLFAPGTVYNEGHLDHAILGKILSKITGRNISDLIREHIFEPLGIEGGTATGDMDRSGLYVHGHTFSFQEKALQEAENPGKKESDLWAASLTDITLTVRDITTIGEAVLNDSLRLAKGGNSAPGSQDSIWYPAFSFPAMFGAGLDTNWRPRAFNLAGAIFGGGQAGYLAVSQGQNCALIIDPQRATCATVALNAAAAKVRVAILNCIFARIGGSAAQEARDFLTPPPANIDFDDFLKPFRPQQLQGRYIGCFADDMLVSAAPNRIDFRIGRDTQLALVRSQDNRLGMQARAPVPIGILPNPVSGEPVIILGMYAFKKAG